MQKFLQGAAVVIASLAFATGASVRAQSDDSQLKAQIERKVSDLKLGRSRVTVMVADHVVTLDGTVPTLWDKMQIIDFARKLDGITEVRSTIDIPKAESDTQLAQEVGKQIRGYSRFTVFDYVDGNVKNGVVTLSGAVTISPVAGIVDKVAQLSERIEKIRGVRELDNQIKVLPTSPSDDQIRYTIAAQIYGDPLFRQYSTANPPVHVIVNAGKVQLIGIVALPLERQKAYEIARSVEGVYEVDNKIQTAAELKR
jgi:hyperosmotically inducible protein